MGVIKKLFSSLKGFNAFLMGRHQEEAALDEQKNEFPEIVPVELHPDMGALMDEMELGLICLSEYFEILKINSSALSILSLNESETYTNKELWNLPLEFFSEDDVLLGKEQNPIWISYQNEDNSEHVLKIKNSQNDQIGWFNIGCKTQFVNGRNNDEYSLSLTIKDITPEKNKQIQLEIRLKMEMLISELTTRFASVNLDEADVEINYALAALAKLTEVDQCYLFLYNESRTTFSCVHEWCDIGIDEQFNNLQNLSSKSFAWWHTMLTSMQTIEIEDLDQLPNDAANEKAFIKTLKMLSLLVVPVVHSGDTVGFIGFTSVRNKKQWKESHVRLLKIAAGGIGGLLKNIEIFRKLATGEQKYRSLIENSGIGVVVVGSDGLYQFVNHTIYEQLGLSESILGQSIHDVLPLETADEVMKDITEVLMGLEVVHKDYVFEFDNSRRWYQTTLQPLIGANGIPDQVILYTQDVQERKENEERIKGLYQISRLTLNGFDCEQDFYKKALKVIHDLIPATCISVASRNADTGKHQLVADHPGECAIRYKNEYHLDEKLNGGHLNERPDFYLFTEKAKVQNILGSDTLSEARSILLVRLNTGDKNGHVLFLVSDVQNFFSEKRLEIVEELVNQLNIGLKQKHLNDRILAYNQNLEVLVAERTAEKNQLDSLNETIIDTTNAIVISSSLDGIVTSFNPMAEKILGFKAEEVIGRMTLIEIYDRRLVKNAVKLAEQMSGLTFESDFKALVYLSDEMPPSNVEFAYVTKEGNTIPVLLSGRTIHDHQNRHIGFINVAMDISRLNAGDIRHRLHWSAFEKFVYALVIADKEGKIVWANECYKELSGYDFSEIYQKKLGELQGSGLQEEKFYKKMWETIQNGDVWRGEVLNKKKDGTIYPEELTIAPVKDDEGNIENYLGIKIDITERNELLKDAFAANQHLKTLVDSLDTVIVFEDRDRKIQLVNQFYCDNFGQGQPRDSFVGMDCLELSRQFSKSTIDPDGFLTRMDDLFINLKPVQNDRIQLLDGRVFNRNFFPIKIGDQLSGYLWQLQNITHQKQVEKHGMIQRLMGYKLAATIDEKQALHVIINSLKQVISTAGAGVYIEKDHSGDAELFASIGFSEEIKDHFFLFSSWEKFTVLAGVSQASYYLVKDFYNPELLKNVSVEKVAVIPFVLKDEKRGYAVLISNIEEQWDYNSRSTLEGMVSQIPPVMERIWKQNIN